jgi:hypothetical protein
VSEYEQWLLDGDVEAAIKLLRRIAAQATRTGTFPPPAHHGRWSNDAVDELLTDMIIKKGGVEFLIDALTSVDNAGSAERYLLKTVQNFLKDQAKSTAHGKLRSRLDTLLGNNPRFKAVTTPVHGWRLADGPEAWWQGDLTVLHHTALQVRGVFIPSWNTSGPTPRPAREALITVALAILTEAAGIVRAEDMARVVLERFRHEIAPETAEHLVLDHARGQVSDSSQEPEGVLAGVGADQLWAGFSSEQRAIVPYLTAPEQAARALGIGPKEAAARRAQVIELVRLATIDDPHAEAVVASLLVIASQWGSSELEMDRLSAEEPTNTEGRSGS